VDFFARQEQTRRTSRALVGLFLLAFAVVALATTAVVAVGVRMYMENNTLFLGTQSWQEWLGAHLTLVAALAGGTFAAMSIASLCRAASLAGGGGHVARMLGATQITGEGSDASHRRLLNVVEEMALASGVPVPEVYVLEQEAGINAFASGTSPANAAIAVTRGALERLDRAELQGVIGHEFSHILNGDMRLNQRLIGLSFGILVLSLVGRWLLRSMRFARPSRGKNSGGVAAAFAIGLALTIIGAIGVFLSRLIKAGVARQREALADASAVQFTREPQALAGALKKIAVHTGRFSSVDTEEVAHMLFERGSRSFSGWFATHPPILERIRALEPDFDPRDLPPPQPLPDPAAVGAAVSPAAPRAQRIDALQAAAAVGGASLATMLERAGRSEAPEVGGALLAALPAEIAHAARSRESSLLLVLALALSATAEVRERQLGLLESQLGSARAAQCRRLFEDLRAVERPLRLPLVEIALPALKQRPREQIVYLFDLLGRIGALDGERRLFDFLLLLVLRAYFRMLPGAPREHSTAPRLGAREAARAVLTNVAAYGSADAAGARAAYAAGLAALGLQRASEAEPPFEPPTAARNLDALEAALRELAAAKPRERMNVLRAVHATIRADRKIEADEHELFRAIAATLDCPLPPGFTI
jgi:Zn-dependent protease with chaperone function